MTTSRQRSRRSARSASGRASMRCRGSRSSSPPTIDWASDGVVHYPGGPTTPTRAGRLADASSIRPMRARVPAGGASQSRDEPSRGPPRVRCGPARGNGKSASHSHDRIVGPDGRSASLVRPNRDHHSVAR
jgi:hypothetical protein